MKENLLNPVPAGLNIVIMVTFLGVWNSNLQTILVKQFHKFIGFKACVKLR